MDTLFLILLAFLASCMVYALVRIYQLARDYSDRRRVFEQHAEGRKAERRSDARRSPGRRALVMRHSPG